MTSDASETARKDTQAVADRASDSARSYASRAAAETSDAVGAAADHAGHAYERAKQGLSDLSDNMPHSPVEAFERSKQTYRSGSERVAKQVGKQPIEALLLAGAIGYLVGWAANRS